MEVMEEVGKMKPLKRSLDQEMADLFNNFQDSDLHENFSPGIVSISSLSQPWTYRIWDINQKFLFWVDNALQAAPQNNMSIEELIAVIPNRGIEQREEHTHPIFLALTDRSRVLSCVESGGQPQLKIVKEDIMHMYRKPQEFKNFTFYHKTGGSWEMASFECAAFPGWFLSTSPEPNKPIHLSRQGAAAITLFHLERMR